MLFGGLVLCTDDGLAEIDRGAPFGDGEIDEVAARGDEDRDEDPRQQVAAFDREGLAEECAGDFFVDHHTSVFLGG